MKNKQHNFSRMKHQLFQMRNAGKKNPIWKLNNEEIHFIEKLGFEVIPRIYRITTKKLVNIKSAKGLLKDIHYSRIKDRKNVIYKKLSAKQVELLKENGIHVVPYKYEIKLR